MQCIHAFTTHRKGDNERADQRCEVDECRHNALHCKHILDLAARSKEERGTVATKDRRTNSQRRMAMKLQMLRRAAERTTAHVPEESDNIAEGVYDCELRHVSLPKRDGAHERQDETEGKAGPKADQPLLQSE